MPLDLNNKNVLVVDDDPGWRSTYTKILIGMRLNVETANSYQSASEKIKSKRFHLLIADVRLQDNVPSDTSGLKILELAKSQNKNIKVILITGYPDAIFRSRLNNELPPDIQLYKTLHGAPLELNDFRKKVIEALELPDLFT